VVQRARFSAVDEQTNVVLCPTQNYTACTSSWRNAKMVFIDANGNGGRDNNEVLIVASDPLSNANTISGITGSLIFDEQGGTAPQPSPYVPITTMQTMHQHFYYRFTEEYLLP